MNIIFNLTARTLQKSCSLATMRRLLASILELMLLCQRYHTQVEVGKQLASTNIDATNNESSQLPHQSRHRKWMQLTYYQLNYY